MKPITPKEGEHPLATSKRSLHRELTLVYGMVWLTTLALLVVIESWWSLLLGVPGVAAGALMAMHWRWSK